MFQLLQTDEEMQITYEDSEFSRSPGDGMVCPRQIQEFQG